MMNTNTALNEAIVKVCTTQFKKDAKAEHELVEAYGYTIYKNNGRFCVQSKNRTISIHHTGNYSYPWKIVSGYYSTHIKRMKEYSDLNKFDYVNCLDTPINTTYYALNQYDRGWGDGINDIHAKYARQRDTYVTAKRDVKYYTRSIDETKRKLAKAIADMQSELEYYTKRKIESEMTLKQCRKELGLA